MKFATSIALASAMSLGSAAAVLSGAFLESRLLEVRQNGNWKPGNCYSSPGDLQQNATINIYQSSMRCTDLGNTKKADVIALTQGNVCYYGNDLPPDSAKVDLKRCDVTCVGFPGESCGGMNTFLVWTNGDVTSQGSGSSSSSSDSSSSSAQSSTSDTSSSTTPQVSTATVNGVVYITSLPDGAQVTVTSSPPASGSSGANKGAIAAGVVVGVVGLAAIAVGAFLFIRSRKQRQEAAELNRQNSTAGFASRTEKPSSTYSMPDSRLEPAFMRRMSDGSIADNQDYSRRILKVTNPDNR